MSGVNLYCVLKSGGEYKANHVEWLRRQVWKHTGKFLTCITDIPNLVPSPVISMTEDWPGWWSKIQLFRPDILGGAFFLDLDTVIVKPFNHILEEIDPHMFHMMKDVYRPQQKGFYQSSVMYVPYVMKRFLYEKFAEDPQYHIRRHATYGDQEFIGQTLEDYNVKILYFQNKFPAEFISYKVHIRDEGLRDPPSKAKIVVFHGQPRPWRTGLPWVPKL